MCVICISKKGVRQPSHEEIVNMFENNPHGAGYMCARNGKVYIHKGFMDMAEFEACVNGEHFTKKDSVVYHFRISTQAGVKPEMTHPFPLEPDMKYAEELDVACSCGVAHNGVIRMTSGNDKRYSDTALFIPYLWKLIRNDNDLHDERVLEMAERLAGSKLAIMGRDGYVATVGDFIDNDGLLFSNSSYKPYEFTSRNVKNLWALL